ncbi:putative Transposase, partial [Globisporangium splendens]
MTTPTNGLGQMLPLGAHDVVSVNMGVVGPASAGLGGGNGNGGNGGDPSQSLKKKKPGRSPSQIWTLLTDEPNPQRKNAAACKHCKQQVLYYKKSEQAIRHLKKCNVFQNSQHQYAFISQFQDILQMYNQKITTKMPSKKRQKTSAAAVAAVSSALDQAAVHHAQAMNQLAMQQGMPDSLMDPTTMGLKDDTAKELKSTGKDRKGKGGGSGALSKSQLERMEEAIAMHAYVTGMAFDAVEECHLQRAIAILRPNVKLPDKKRLEGDLLHRCYDKMHKQVWNYLTASSTRVCIKRDAWSSMNLYNTSNPEEVYVTYMAGNNEKRFFLESEKINDDGQYNSILIAQDIKRVMAPIVGSVSGVVTGSTEYHARAWEMLKTEYPTKFFYGCISHALHLAIMDIFGPEKSIENDPRRMTPQVPMDFPFQDLVDFTNNCNELLSFFSSYQYAPKFKMFDAQTLQTMKSFSTSSPTMQWGSLAARFRVLLQAEDIIQSIVSDPDFIDAAPLNQRPTRDSLKSFVLNLNWKIALEKAISILTPIELTLYKFQDDKPISEVYFESKHLLTDFDAVFGLSTVELEYIKKVVTERWQYVLSEAHGLAFLLDPRYIGKSMTREYREQIEELIFNFPETDADIGVNEERKRAISAEYTDYVIYAKNQRANRTFKWEMLEKGNRSPLQFWMTEADDWPHLKSLALTLFSLAPSSVASEKTLCKSTLLQSSRRNKLSFDDMRRLAFISINDTQFTGNRVGDFQNALPDFNMNDPGLSPEGMMMWMI